MSVLNDLSLLNGADAGGYDKALVNPASVDLRLGSQIRCPHPVWYTMTRDEMVERIIDGTIDSLPTWGDPFEFVHHWLMPGDFVLCHSLEYVTVPNDAIALLYSKSSTGRRGLEHLHAGVGDPGFSGQWTWELHNVAPWPIKLVAGQRLMQQIVIRMTDKPQRSYIETGRYQGQTGATPAKGEL